MQVLSTTVGQNNHVLNQVDILLRELCRLHQLAVPTDVENLVLPQHQPGVVATHMLHQQPQNLSIDDSDAEDIEDVIGESEQESEGDEDLPLEMDDGRNANKKDEMELEHLATLERLRQSQRQDYLKVNSKHSTTHVTITYTNGYCSFILFFWWAGLCFRFGPSYRSSDERIT